jgi:hypothetical protein
VLGTDLGADLHLHQRLGQYPNPLAQEVDVARFGLAHKLQQLHLGHGHHVAPLDVLIEPFTSRTYAVATSSSASIACSYTTPWDATAWSPDASHLVYATPTGLVVTTPDGTRARRLALSGLGEVQLPDWIA